MNTFENISSVIDAGYIYDETIQGYHKGSRLLFFKPSVIVLCKLIPFYLEYKGSYTFVKAFLNIKSALDYKI